MTFTSIAFAIFFPIVFGAYLCLRHRGQNWLLLAASYVFYGWWDWRFLSLILISTVVDYFVALGIEASDRPGRRKLLVTISMVSNLGMLGVFKYFGFFAESLKDVAAMFGVDLGYTTMHIVLPVGISFYTFQTMSYTIDVYRGHLKATRRFFDLALFVAFFPQLVAGPIERASHLVPQILHPRVVTWEGVSRGMVLVLIGLVKKMAIADGVARSVASVYGSTSADALDILLATYLFAVQIYCDFSGYTDIARGVSKMFGIDLMVNFNLPYIATNPSDFWRRWHISLSTWLRDYLYIPLGGNRGSKVRTQFNLMATMVLGGIWHGAAWNFVLWGFFHGAILCIARPFMPRGGGERTPMTPRRFLIRVVKAAIFFHVICYGWLLFRAQSFSQIVEFTQTLVTFSGDFDLAMARPKLVALPGLMLIVAYELGQLATGSSRYYERFPLIVRAAIYALAIFTICMGMSNDPQQFIYFQF